MEGVNLVLFFSSIAMIGAIKYFEGWKSFFISFGIWVCTIGISAMIFETLNLDKDGDWFKIIGLFELLALNSGYFLYLFKKGYLGFIIPKK